MRNWSTDTTRLRKNTSKYTIWFLEQQINFGLDEGEWINERDLRSHWNDLCIDPKKKRYLSSLLWP